MQVELFVQTVQAAAWALWHFSRTKLFGSHALGTALPESPIDIVILDALDFMPSEIGAG